MVCGVNSVLGFVEVASVKDLGPGKMAGVEAGSKEVFIASVDGKYYAIGDRCTHIGRVLSDGALKGDSVTCSCHGSTFKVKIGNVVKEPARESEPVYEVKVGAD